MRELNLKEISSISGGAQAISDLTPLQASNWVAAYFGGQIVGTAATEALKASSYEILHSAAISNLGGLVAGVVAAAGSYLVTKFVTDRVEPYV